MRGKLYADEHRAVDAIKRHRFLCETRGSIQLFHLAAGRVFGGARLPPHVHVEERVAVEKGAMLADQGPDLVGEDAVKSDSTKAELFPGPAKLPLPVGTQGEQRPPAPDRVLPDVGERCPLAGGVDPEMRYHEATSRGQCNRLLPERSTGPELRADWPRDDVGLSFPRTHVLGRAPHEEDGNGNQLET